MLHLIWPCLLLVMEYCCSVRLIRVKNEKGEENLVFFFEIMCTIIIHTLFLIFDVDYIWIQAFDMPACIRIEFKGYKIII